MSANISANFMERIAIIDHANHALYIDDIDEDVLNEKYDGEEEKYILDQYEFDDDDLWSWEYVTNVMFYSKNERKINLGSILNEITEE